MNGEGAGSAAVLAAAVLAAMVAGLALGWIAARRAARSEAESRIAAAAARLQAESGAEAATARERIRGLEAERAQLLDAAAEQRRQSELLRRALELARDEKTQWAERAARLPQLEDLLADAQGRIEEGAAELADARSRAAQAEAALASERRQSAEKLALLTEAREALTHQFRSLANDILEEKGRRFAEQNQASLGTLLDPLRERLQDFQGRVERFYETEGKERSALAQQVHHLMALNRTLSDDAQRLTAALKGSNKSQGNWGELILERVLEASGLRRGHEYDIQESHNREDGTRAQPDVVIHLPEERHLVVDAKISLIAYEEFASAGDDDALRAAAQRRHLESIRAHIRGLSSKNYQQLYRIKSLDFVLMFVPIEPAFMVAVTGDGELYMDAWNRNVLLVSPSTLLFVVRTVAHLWRQEAQNRNAQDIARRGAELYDRLSGFVADLEKVGERLQQAQASYHGAYDKLTRNKGSVVRQAEMLRQLGVKPARAMPQAALDAAALDGGWPPVPAEGMSPAEPACGPGADGDGLPAPGPCRIPDAAAGPAAP
ncbi:MAG: DNA recombination protein RmuC [Xylophilus ampelinus]